MFIIFTISLLILFLFQAEDGIRHDLVTVVQTCALPIISYAVFCLKKNKSTDERVNFSGKHYTVTHLKGSAAHLPTPPPPSYNGTRGKRICTRAGYDAGT